ncbi:MAG: transglutaminase-like domain-containing protein [Planctomycetes bacterium]|nr:transglutaminase-like domain-containing protein [Planctomycetota bacterium]
MDHLEGLLLERHARDELPRALGGGRGGLHPGLRGFGHIRLLRSNRGLILPARTWKTTSPVFPSECAECLKETKEFPLSNALLRKLLPIVGNENASSETIAGNVVEFVHEHLEFASQPGHVLPLQSILEGRKGDCTEHAILCVAMLRGRGIAARIAGGLAYMGDKQKAFGPHAWAEAVLGGFWIPVDPTWNQKVADATHLCLDHTVDGENGRLVEGRLRFVVRNFRK